MKNRRLVDNSTYPQHILDLNDLVKTHLRRKNLRYAIYAQSLSNIVCYLFNYFTFLLLYPVFAGAWVSNRNDQRKSESWLLLKSFSFQLDQTTTSIESTKKQHKIVHAFNHNIFSIPDLNEPCILGQIFKSWKGNIKFANSNNCTL